MERDLLYHGLTRKIIGVFFEVNKELGFGYPEKIYQEAISQGFKDKDLIFERERFSRISFRGHRVGSMFYDFLVDGKVVVEVKTGRQIFENHTKQLLSYLKDSGIKVGLLVSFTPKGVIYKRLVN